MDDEEQYCLLVGTEVSAKYRGAFCEAKIKSVKKSLLFRISIKKDGKVYSVAEDAIQGTKKVGSTVEVELPETAGWHEGVVLGAKDKSIYTVEFDDGDVRTLSRGSLCLRGENQEIAQALQMNTTLASYRVNSDSQALQGNQFANIAHGLAVQQPPNTNVQQCSSPLKVQSHTGSIPMHRSTPMQTSSNYGLQGQFPHEFDPIKGSFPHQPHINILPQQQPMWMDQFAGPHSGFQPGHSTRQMMVQAQQQQVGDGGQMHYQAACYQHDTSLTAMMQQVTRPQQRPVHSLTPQQMHGTSHHQFRASINPKRQSQVIDEMRPHEIRIIGQNTSMDSTYGLTTSTLFQYVAGPDQNPNPRKPTKKMPSKSLCSTTLSSSAPMQASSNVYGLHGQFPHRFDPTKGSFPHQPHINILPQQQPMWMDQFAGPHSGFQPGHSTRQMMVQAQQQQVGDGGQMHYQAACYQHDTPPTAMMQQVTRPQRYPVHSPSPQQMHSTGHHQFRASINPKRQSQVIDEMRPHKIQMIGQNTSMDSTYGLTTSTLFQYVAGPDQNPNPRKPTKKMPSKSLCSTNLNSSAPMQASSNVYGLHGQFPHRFDPTKGSFPHQPHINILPQQQPMWMDQFAGPHSGFQPGHSTRQMMVQAQQQQVGDGGQMHYQAACYQHDTPPTAMMQQVTRPQQRPVHSLTPQQMHGTRARHFAEGDTLDQLPLTDPENFGAPVLNWKQKAQRKDTQASSLEVEDVESDDQNALEVEIKEKSYTKPELFKEEKESVDEKRRKWLSDPLMGKLVLVEPSDKRKHWYPAVCVNPFSIEECDEMERNEIVVRSFKNGKLSIVNRCEHLTRSNAPSKVEVQWKDVLESAFSWQENTTVPDVWKSELSEDEKEESKEMGDEKSREFLEQLYKFMEDRGSPITKPPVLDYKHLDLYLLYNLVLEKGGFFAINDSSDWKEICTNLGIAKITPAAGYHTKMAYSKYLLCFEEYVMSFQQNKSQQESITKSPSKKSREMFRGTESPRSRDDSDSSGRRLSRRRKVSESMSIAEENDVSSSVKESKRSRNITGVGGSQTKVHHGNKIKQSGEVLGDVFGGSKHVTDQRGQTHYHNCNISNEANTEVLNDDDDNDREDELWSNLKKSLKRKALEICGEEDQFLGKNIQLAELQISTEPPSVDESMSGHGHHRNDIARYFNKPPHGSVPYTRLFEEVKRIAEEASKNCRTQEAAEKFALKHGSVVFLSGNPGIGKTTLTKRLVEEMWQDYFNKPDFILFFIRFRDVNFQAKTDLLEFFAPFEVSNFSETKQRNILRKLSKNSENVYIIMDGLDEADIDPRSKLIPVSNVIKTQTTAENFVKNLLVGNILPQSKKMVTSRPYRFVELLGELRPTILCTIQGLDDSGIDQICSDICRKDKQFLRKSIVDHLQGHPDLKSYCHTPVSCIMVITSLKEIYSTDTTLLEMVSHTLTAIFVIAITKWHSKKPGFPGKFQMKEICLLAFDGFWNGLFYFPACQLEEIGVNIDQNSSFVNAILKGSNKLLYFVHLMWQEFLAALYLRLYMDEEKFKTWISKLNTQKYEMVARFLFGICNDQVLNDLLEFVEVKERNTKSVRDRCKESLKQFVIKELQKHPDTGNYFSSILPILNWVREMGDIAFTKQAASCLRNELNINGQIFPSDIPSIRHLLRARDDELALDVRNPMFVGNCSNYFFKELLDSMDNNKIRMKWLDIDDIPVDGDVHRFIFSRCIDEVKGLTLQSCNITNQIVGELVQRIKKRNKKMEWLDLSFNEEISDEGAAMLKEVLGKVKWLELIGCEGISDGMRKELEDRGEEVGCHVGW